MKNSFLGVLGSNESFKGLGFGEDQAFVKSVRSRGNSEQLFEDPS